MNLKRRRWTVATGTVSVTAILAMSLPVAASARQHSAQAERRSVKAETLRLILRDAVETEVDVHKDGLGAGDYAVQAGSVFQGTKKIGRLTQSCTVVAVKPVPWPQCTLDLVLARGQVTIQGSFALSGSKPQLAVTGGTGTYEGVRGQLTETGSDDVGNRVTLHLLHP